MAEAPFGLYGKLPAKRDFIALNLPAGFLGVWEEWLHASIAASREQLGDRWLELFLSLPIWRFWLGRDICGQTVTGALMPSVDGVGRYFPLCICAGSAAGHDVAPPPAQPMPEWFATVEAALLKALDPAFAGEPLDLVMGMAPPPSGRADSGEEHLASLLRQELQSMLGGESWFWTLGGGAALASVKRYKGLPDPYAFSEFLGSNPNQARASGA